MLIVHALLRIVDYPSCRAFYLQYLCQFAADLFVVKRSWINQAEVILELVYGLQNPSFFRGHGAVVLEADLPGYSL